MTIQYTIDGHFDMLGDVCQRRRNGEREVIRRCFYPAFAAGHVTGVVASIFVDSCRLPYGALEDAMEQVGALHCEIAESHAGHLRGGFRGGGPQQKTGRAHVL